MTRVDVVRSYLPSPSAGVWDLGPVPIRAYAFCLLAGIVVAVVWTERRWVTRGGRPGGIIDIAVWAVPAGIIGARLYHLVTDPELYFASGRNPWDAFAIWHGGLGIWGAVAGGALGAAYGCRRYGVRLEQVAWAIAPALPVAQAIGRFGNYFNQELYGRPSTLPWALRIDPAHRPADTPGVAFYQPTFAYEAVWDVGVAGLVVWAQRRFALSGWRSFALYVAAYTVGRGWIEDLRVDHANHFLGLRVNDWVSLAMFIAAAGYLIVSRPSRRAQPTNLTGVDALARPVKSAPNASVREANADAAVVSAGRPAQRPPPQQSSDR